MVSAETVRTFIGIIGNVISFFLFASPSPTFWRIIKKKDVEGFSPDPYLACVMNCLFWIFYGLPVVHPDSTLVVTINGIGLIIELIYLAIFCVYCTRRQRIKVFLVILAEIIVLGGVAAITMELFHTHAKRSTLVGALCVIFGVIMYTSPLTIMWKVIRTKSVKYMPFCLSLAAFLNGLIWLVYALIKFDLNITIANGLGAVSGFCQLILYASFYRTTNWNDDDEIAAKPRSELQLPNVANRPQV